MGFRIGFRVQDGVRFLERSTSLSAYSLHCSSFFWFNPFYVKDPKR